MIKIFSPDRFPETRLLFFDLSEDEVKHELNEMEINNGNDRLTKEFNETFWDHVKVLLLLSFKMAFLKKEVSTSEKQAVINLIGKKELQQKVY